MVAIRGVVLLPVLAPGLAALVVLLLDALSPRLARLTRWVGLAGLGIGAATAVAQGISDNPSDRLTLCLPAPEGRCFYDPGTAGSLLQVAALAAAFVVLILLAGSDSTVGPDSEVRSSLQGGATVTTTLVLATATGAATVAAAVDLGTWLVGLELATLPVVALVALRGTSSAAHGALSLLTTALVSFGLLVVGAALWLVATGEPTFSSAGARGAWSDLQTRSVLVLAVVFALAGLGFKVSAVPFHTWTPQAYSGATVPVAALLATVSKIAAVAGLLAVLRGIVPLATRSAYPHQVAFLLACLAVATMTLGNVVALRQDDVVRLLAWSTIAQAGWVLLPLAAIRASGLDAAATYVVAYAVASLVAFAVVPLVGRQLAAYTGLLRADRLLGGTLLLALVSLAGLPPGIVGLVAKVVALRPVMDANLWPLALVAVANAVVGIAVYLRWVAVLFGDPDPVAPPRRPGRQIRFALVLAAAALIVTSVAPQTILGLTASSASASTVVPAASRGGLPNLADLSSAVTVDCRDARGVDPGINGGIVDYAGADVGGEEVEPEVLAARWASGIGVSSRFPGGTFSRNVGPTATFVSYTDGTGVVRARLEYLHVRSGWRMETLSYC